ncbi:DNA-3-methyladenine glycosylase family protein [Oceaniglobus trochenteri]|uniref:DNA-3-methyladenine glycosylase family protein n=1 Tax=Oceaniglobus trochenteri TaxID=2763260 RepID=UPI001CFF9B1C|nr:DNA-3-methyladenine glycosylase 2 family protein [Oceaniglobus trochenteri]
MSVGRILDTPDDMAEGAAWLIRVEPRFAEVLALTGPWPLRRRAGGFATLLFAIVGQQVSVASAAALWAKTQAAGLDDRAAVAAASDDDLRACGLSRPKVRYAKALADSDFDFDVLADLPDDEVIARLTALLGIGRWTADIYAAFALGRADVIAAGDLAVQEGARVLFDLPARPDEARLRALAEPWAPWRGVAARGLWAYYAHIKTREGIG